MTGQRDAEVGPGRQEEEEEEQRGRRRREEVHGGEVS